MTTTPALQRIPRNPEKFRNYITKTDDCQLSIDTVGFTIYPVDENGNKNYGDKEKQKEVINQPMYVRWEWTPGESAEWSKFRKEFDNVYQQYLKGDEGKKKAFEKQLEQIISSCIAFDSEQQLIERVAIADYSTPAHFKTFGIRQDTYEYKTSFRTISFKYEKALALNKNEKEYIKKYTALHEQAQELWNRIIKLRSKIKEVHATLPAYWEKIPALKDKSDKASNTIFLPPPAMKGSFSEAVGFYVPTAEENKKNAEEYNKFNFAFYDELAQMCTHCDTLFEELEWIMNIFNEGDKSLINNLFEETEELKNEMFDNLTGSFDVMSLDDDHEDFLGKWSEVSKESDEADADWEILVKEQSLMMDVYNNLVKFLNGDPEDDNEDDDEAVNLQANAPQTIDNSPDDLAAETIKRYESDLKMDTSTYFDSTDWHIILDYYEKKYDSKNKELAFERAMAQHPDHPALLIRKASDLSNEHQYQQSLELLKRVEQQGPPHHPNFYYVKASVYLQLQTPERAIPLYEKLIAQEEKELKWWRINSYTNLIDIYEKKKNYEECIRLTLELIAEEPEDEYHMSNLARLYCFTGKPDVAELALNSFLENHPKSSVCLERLGHVYMEMKQYDKAIPCYDNAFKFDKDNFYQAVSHKGKALMELKRYKEAAACFELCILYFKLGKDYHLHAAQCYEKLNIAHQAMYHYRKVLALNPDSREAMDGLDALKEQMKK